MRDKLTVGELKQALQMLDDARQVFIYHDGFQEPIPARSAYALHETARAELIFVIDNRP